MEFCTVLGMFFLMATKVLVSIIAGGLCRCFRHGRRDRDELWHICCKRVLVNTLNLLIHNCLDSTSGIILPVNHQSDGKKKVVVGRMKLLCSSCDDPWRMIVHSYISIYLVIKMQSSSHLMSHMTDALNMPCLFTQNLIKCLYVGWIIYAVYETLDRWDIDCKFHILQDRSHREGNRTTLVVAYSSHIQSLNYTVEQCNPRFSSPQVFPIIYGKFT